MNEVIIIGTADYRPDPRNPVFVSDRFLNLITLRHLIKQISISLRINRNVTPQMH